MLPPGRDRLATKPIPSRSAASAAVYVASDPRPRWMEVVGDWNVRGGIKTVIRVAHGKRPER
jgi:QueF-like protein